MPPLFCLLVSVVSFSETAETPAVRWLNPPEGEVAVTKAGQRFDPVLRMPDLSKVRMTSGATRIEFRPAGEHVVELFLLTPAEGRYSFALEAEGQTVDDRLRLRTTDMRQRPVSARFLTVSGVVRGPATLVVRTTAPDYGMGALRYTPRDEWERDQLPAIRDRARRLQAAIEPGMSEGQRPAYLQQMYDRLALARDPELRKEALLGQTRHMYWRAAENHEPNDLVRLRELLEQCLRTMPSDPVVRQMVSASCRKVNIRRDYPMTEGKFCGDAKGVFWRSDVPDAPGAPEWASAQRRLKARMETITRWWVDERQLPSGEIGGGWGDDVEILRHWGPLALGLGSPVAAKGLERIADGIWASGQLRNGYYKDITDVEHSSEPSTDTTPLLAALRPDDPKVIARLAETAACAQHWIGRQPDGYFRFHSSWFNCREADRSPARAVDVHLNARAMGPALWYAYLTRDKMITSLLWYWGESWVKAMRETAHGKPAGMIPSAMRAKDGSYLIGSERWDKPAVEWDYFQWSGGSQETLTSLLLALGDLTQDGKWLQAAGESFAAANEEMKKAPEAFFEWRRRSAKDHRYDRFFGWTPAPADADILAQMAKQAKEAEEWLSADFDMFTREVLWTDRVYYPMTPEYRQALFGGEAPRGERYPLFAVTWEPAATDFARAVLSADPESLRLRVFSFEAQPARAVLRAWRLQPGQYRWKIRETGEQGTFAVTRVPHRMELPLAPGREVTIEIRRK